MAEQTREHRPACGKRRANLIKKGHSVPMDWLGLFAAVSFLTVLGAPGESPYWRAVISGLDGVRASAFTSGDASLLDFVYPAGSELHRSDVATMTAYASRGLTIDGMRMRILSLRVLDQDASAARLEIVDQLGATRVRTNAGEWRSLPTDRQTRRVVTLAFTEAGWRITSAQTK